MSFFPIYLKVDNKSALIVGGGKVAERKTFDLLQGDSDVYVMSPFLSDGLTMLLKEGRINWIASEFAPDEVPEDIFLIIAATDSEEVNREIYNYAKSRNILINVVDSPDLCDFYVPSVIRRGEVTIAISTGGRAPSFSRALREFIESVLPEDISRALDFISDVRTRLMDAGVSQRGKILLKSAREVISKIGSGENLTEVKREIEEKLKDEI